ncbi:MAG: hypothetical protein QOJ59_574 [Thermomicrobiales bacterium]|nr:hypothetical protein [Thermomicrobiales bacterium]
MTVATLERRLTHAEQLIERVDAPAPAWANPVELAEALNIVLDGWQRRLLLSTARRVVVRAPRQTGKTTTVSVLALFVAVTTPDGLVLVVSPAERQAKELVRVVRRLAAVLGLATAEREQTVAPSAVSMTRLEFPNGARVLSVPGSSEATIRGFAAPSLILVDEASRVAEPTLDAIRPMMAAAPASRLILLSSPWTKAGLFYKAATDETGVWERHRVTLDDCPRISRAFVEEERRTLPPWVFSREYLGEFADDDLTLFPAELIARAMSDDVAPFFAEAS